MARKKKHKVGTHTGTPMGGEKFKSHSRQKKDYSVTIRQNRYWASKNGPVTVSQMSEEDLKKAKDRIKDIRLFGRPDRL